MYAQFVLSPPFTGQYSTPGDYEYFIQLKESHILLLTRSCIHNWELIIFGHLHRIGIHVVTRQCRKCGDAEDTAGHVLFDCQTLCHHFFLLYTDAPGCVNYEVRYECY